MISKLSTYLLTGLSAFFLPISWALISVIVIVGIDTVTGVMAAGKNDVKNIESRKMGRVVSKIIYYFSAIIICNIAALHIDDQIPFVKLSLVAIMTIEVKSIDENFRKTFGFSFVDKLLKGFKKLNRKDSEKD
tara:strand:+ start:7378 stop:7776 length:399 start_codon:yes stop_codon:yes gene_type:complete